MSTERMMVTAMQEQPTLLLPILVLLYFIVRVLASAARTFSTNRTNRGLRY
ncbi:MAG TPA: hypothetical protein VN920_17230 [Pyrinomonadaceae bacterium]|nr:hypothetical protein [Pyrinomonadaceae bacterium]